MSANWKDAWAVHSDVLDWLVASGNDWKIHEQCQVYQQESNDVQRAVYRFLIECDPSLLLEYNVSLGSYVLNNYREAAKTIQEVCYTLISQLQWIPCQFNICKSQVSVVLRLLSLPTIPEYEISSTTDIPPIQNRANLVTFTGIVSGLSTVTKYTQSTRYYCSSDHADRFNYIRVHKPGASEAATARNDFLCDQCGSLLQEDVTCRLLSDKVTVDMIPFDAIRSQSEKRPPTRFQSLTVILRDELSHGVHIGQRCSIIGIPVYNVVEVHGHCLGNVYLEANNVILESTSCSITTHSLVGSATLQSLLAIAVPSLSPGMSQLIRDCSFSPWSFSATLAYIFAGTQRWRVLVCVHARRNLHTFPNSLFAGTITPPGTFHKLKLSILLSLVNVISKSHQQDKDSKLPNDKSLFHLLVIGRHVVEIQRLLSYSSSLSPICCHHQSSNDMFGTATKDKFGANAFIEGGSLLLSTDGVCLIDDVIGLKKEALKRLQTSMENDEVFIDIPKRFTDELHREQQQMIVKLSSTIWASCSSEASRERKGQTADTNGTTGKEAVPLSKSLTDRFGLLVFTDEENVSTDTWAEQQLTEHLLGLSTMSSIPDSNPFPVNDRDIVQLLYRAAFLKSTFCASALELIRAFYLASRRIRGSSVHGTDISVTALHAMKSLAAAHAKLHLRNEVLEEDAVSAIHLCEEAMTSQYGYSLVGVKPLPHFQDSKTDTYIGKEYDARMRQFHLHLLRFCTSHGYLGFTAREE
ncbi:minichromosome maintenance domain-containing protein 2-like isoform X2 [Corticium candelabrum]|uniref:minichromosome maintenance domain-containing protein 2-like isoform X2 n=1 Tax=Corticium candelabrum TaxID=121492 RepID=UPI002E27395F|nr:minichromosome maintenance domain-containing protein 2-like isoform X2 [Corticium candelabrum]